MIKSVFSFVFTFSLLFARAQQGTVAAGGDAAGSGGTVSYSVGQAVYTTNTAKDGSSVSQGIQQTYEIIRTGGNPESSKFAVVYPNPVQDYLILRVTGYEFENLRYEFYDIIGKFISSRSIVSEETRINTTDLAVGEYSVAVYQGNVQYDTFTILKYK